jgi:hypothetical protein
VALGLLVLAQPVLLRLVLLRPTLAQPALESWCLLHQSSRFVRIRLVLCYPP